MTEVPCEPGFYSDAVKLDACKVCETGHICPFMYTLNALPSQKKKCPKGHECPSGQLSEATPCAAGKYQDAETDDG